MAITGTKPNPPFVYNGTGSQFLSPDGVDAAGLFDAALVGTPATDNTVQHGDSPTFPNGNPPADYFDIPDGIQTTNMTVSCAFRAATNDGSPCGGWATTGGGFAFFINNLGAMQLLYYSGAALQTITTANFVFVPDQDYSFIATLSASGAEFFIDDVSIGTDASAYTPFAGETNVGGFHQAGSVFGGLDGVVYSLEFIPSVLSGAAITAKAADPYNDVTSAGILVPTASIILSGKPPIVTVGAQMSGHSVISDVKYTSSSTTSPFTVSLSAGAKPAPVGQKYIVAISQDDDPTIWSNLKVTQTDANTITENVVIDSSGGAGNAPTFTGAVTIISGQDERLVSVSGLFGYDIILAGGQSNNVGFGELEFDENIHADENVWYLNPKGDYANKITPSRLGFEPLVDTTPPAGAATTRTSLIVMQFAKDYSASIGHKRRVLIINRAEAGIGFVGGWNPDGNRVRYDRLVSDTNSFTATSPDSRVVACGMHIGENDAHVSVSATESEEKGYMTSFDTNLRADINTTNVMNANDKAKFPIIYGGMHDDLSIETVTFPTFTDVQAALTDAPNFIARNEFASAVGITGQIGDNIHFNDAGLTTLGSRYFPAYERVLES